MRTFRICRRILDAGSGGADRRDVQCALLYFGFDYAGQRFDRIGYFLLVTGISQFLDFNSSGHRFAQTGIS